MGKGLDPLCTNLVHLLDEVENLVQVGRIGIGFSRVDRDPGKIGYAFNVFFVDGHSQAGPKYRQRGSIVQERQPDTGA